MLKLNLCLSNKWNNNNKVYPIFNNKIKVSNSIFILFWQILILNICLIYEIIAKDESSLFNNNNK